MPLALDLQKKILRRGPPALTAPWMMGCIDDHVYILAMHGPLFLTIHEGTRLVLRTDMCMSTRPGRRCPSNSKRAGEGSLTGGCLSTTRFG